MVGKKKEDVKIVTSGAGAAAIAITELLPVSYTHLEAVQGSGDLPPSGLYQGSRCHLPLHLQQRSPGQHGPGPVSYTHLDLFSYPPFVGFFNNFTAAYQEIEDDFKA